MKLHIIKRLGIWEAYRNCEIARAPHGWPLARAHHLNDLMETLKKYGH